MKIHHVLLYRFRSGCDRIEEHLAMILTFRGNTDGLIDLKCGKNILSTSSGRFTHGFVMTFASLEALTQYNKSEAHDILVETFRADIADKVVFDFQSL